MEIFKEAKVKLIGITKPIDPNFIPDSEGILSYCRRELRSQLPFLLKIDLSKEEV